MNGSTPLMTLPMTSPDGFCPDRLRRDRPRHIPTVRNFPSLSGLGLLSFSKFPTRTGSISRRVHCQINSG